VEIIEGKGAVFVVNVGHPIVTNWVCGIVILCCEGGISIGQLNKTVVERDAPDIWFLFQLAQYPVVC